MPNNYDNIASYYDRISRFVFGTSLLKAQTCFLDQLEPGSSILIVGGGTGGILEDISKIHPQGLRIDYVEPSVKMTGLAKKRDWKKNLVNFIQQPVEDFKAEKEFDHILTFFLFDNFPQKKARDIFEKLGRLLKPGGYWFFADFSDEPGKQSWWHPLLLKSMYLFFRITCHIEARSLVNMERIFETVGYKKTGERNFYSGFIKSVVYKKPEDD